MPKERIAPQPQEQTKQKKEELWQTARQVIEMLNERDSRIMLKSRGATLEIRAMAKEKDGSQPRLLIDLREWLTAHGSRCYINSLTAMFVPDNPTDSFILTETRSPTFRRTDRSSIIPRFRYSYQERQKAPRQSEGERHLPFSLSRLDIERICSQTEVPNSINFPATTGKICKIVVEEILNKPKKISLAPEIIEALKNALFQQPAK